MANIRRFHTSSALIAIAAFLVGSFATERTAAAPNREHLQLIAEIRMMHEEQSQLQVLLGTLNDALKTLTTRIDEHAGLNRKAFADQRLLVDNVSGDIRVVKEKVDDTNVRITSLREEIEALRMSIPRGGPTTLEPAAAGDPAASPPGRAPGAPLPPGQTPERLYASAYADYTAGQWALSVLGFQEYIRAFPKSDMADDAQYYVGENHFNDRKFKDAIDAFDLVIKNYPGSNKTPEAYYKRGRAYEELKQTAQARESYEFVVKNFRDSDAGTLARQSLERLNRTRQE